MALAASYAALLAVSTAAKDHPVTATILTVVLLLILGTVLWSFLRRSRRDGVLPLAVDRLDEAHPPEPADPAQLAADGRVGRPADPEHAPGDGHGDLSADDGEGRGGA